MGLKICAKTLIFGILTLDQLFLKLCGAILLILSFLPFAAFQKCLEWQKMAKNCTNHHFQLQRPQIGVKNQIIKIFHTAFLKNHMRMLYAKFQAILTDIVGIYLHSSKFLKHFFVQINPKILNFASQISKERTMLAQKLTGNHIREYIFYKILGLYYHYSWR